jgi:L-2-hydroxyglutarate oxidase
VIAIVGGGIVGLATAYALRHLGPVVFEKEKTVAAHQTGHNSGVIHTGVYYRPGTQRAKLCVEGARMMIDFCREHAIPHEICGKVIVATEASQLPRLDVLIERAQANGVKFERIGLERMREIEPHMTGLAGIWLPTAGIADYGAVARKLASFVEVRTGVRVDDVRKLGAKLVINCAGLYSDRVARSRLKIVPFRGEYYYLKRPQLVRGLIYPVPDISFPFLDVHFTRRAMSPVLNQPPVNVRAVASGWFQYPAKSIGDRTSNSPSTSLTTSAPAASTRRTATFANGRPTVPARRSPSYGLPSVISVSVIP